jgi:hypothetical protein
MSLYTNLTNTSARLLAKYGQGVVDIGRPVTVEPANPWGAPTTTTDWTPINAAVSGVSQKYVDGVNIVVSDREVLTQVAVSFDAAAGDKIRIDGHVVAVLAVHDVPAAGDPVVTRFIVRG